ncbi:MAG: hypothetical protein ACI3ZD_07915, partial [Prevotella sp.]
MIKNKSCYIVYCTTYAEVEIYKRMIVLFLTLVAQMSLLAMLTVGYGMGMSTELCHAALPGTAGG